jgi:putative flippase GtrA
MTSTPPTHWPEPASPSEAPVLDVVVPVYNEQYDLAPSVERLRDHLARTFPYSFRITIADNASTDATPGIARSLAERYDEVTSVRLDQKGRGRALAATWSVSDAAVLAYMDVDLSTDLGAFLPLVAPLISGHSHLAIGTRLARGSRVVRGPKREVISRCYNLILKGTLATRFSDAQCGFKAIRADVAAELLPHIEDTGWFFDTELLVLAERAGLRVHEVPVDWVDDPDSTVDVVATAITDLKGVGRLIRNLATGAVPTSEIGRRLADQGRWSPGTGSFTGQVARFGAIGVISTLSYGLLYLLLRTGLSAQWSNLVALAVTAVGNTAANRRFTFGVIGHHRLWLHHLQGLVVFGVGLALTSGSLAALHVLVSGAARQVELAVLVAANVAATVVRFVGLRTWVFARHRSAPSPAMMEHRDQVARPCRQTIPAAGTGAYR